MHTTPQLEEYYLFLDWFEKNHPDLSESYRQFIIVPKSNEGVQVLEKGLNAAVCKTLQQIGYDYYHPWRKSIPA